PTAVVYARELSVPAILEAAKAGHVFVDLTGSRNRLLEFSASSPGSSAAAGDVLPAPAGAEVQISAHVTGCPGSSAFFLLDEHADSALSPATINESDATLKLSWTSDGKKHWLRTEVKTPDGKLQLLGNPIYINYQNSASESETGSPAAR